MRTALLCVLILGLATAGWAGVTSVKSAARVEPAAPDQELLWYQAPHYYVWTLNASTAFGSEFADDIPADLYPYRVYGLIFYAGEWAGYWQNPSGFYINYYFGCCPPGTAPNLSYYYAWDNARMTRQLYYSSPGWFESWEVTQMFEPVGARDPCMSIGFQLDTPWGPTPPYAGVAATDYYDVYGCGQAYWCFEYYGIGRWVTIGSYFGVTADMAYGLIGRHEPPSATATSTWGAVKSIYE
jgi:hypothetical protein